MSKKFVYEEMWPGYINDYYNRSPEDSGSYSALGIRWIYAMLLVIVIVLQFGKRDYVYTDNRKHYEECEYCEFNTSRGDHTYSGSGENQLIDNSVLFIIVVFLLILCGGCWPNK